MKWKDKLLSEVYCQLKSDKVFANAINDAFVKNKYNIHLAIFNEPYLSLLFSGKKTIESRLSSNNITPYGKIQKDDLVLVKRSGGAVEGIFIAGEVRSIRGVENIKNCLTRGMMEEICIDADTTFAESKNLARFATFIPVMNIMRINTIDINKNDRAGWVLLKKGFRNTLFNDFYE